MYNYNSLRDEQFSPGTDQTAGDIGAASTADV